MILQIRISSDIVIDQFIPTSGSFSKSYPAEGQKWSESGTYVVQVSYMGQTVEESFSFSIKQPASEQVQDNESETQTTDSESEAQDDDPESLQQNQGIAAIQPKKPKVVVKGFPHPSYASKYYYDRYENEKAFRDWFDEVFPNSTIYKVVGQTNVTLAISSLLVQYADDWEDGKTGDREFANMISELIRYDVISVDEDIILQDSEDIIPDWFRNIARWYADKTIAEEDFMNGLEYLIERGIISISMSQ